MNPSTTIKVLTTIITVASTAAELYKLYHEKDSGQGYRCRSNNSRQNNYGHRR